MARSGHAMPCFWRKTPSLAVRDTASGRPIQVVTAWDLASPCPIVRIDRVTRSC